MTLYMSNILTSMGYMIFTLIDEGHTGLEIIILVY